MCIREHNENDLVLDIEPSCIDYTQMKYFPDLSVFVLYVHNVQHFQSHATYLKSEV